MQEVDVPIHSSSFSSDGRAIYGFDNWMASLIAPTDFVGTQKDLIRIALVEAFTNIVRHSLKGDPALSIVVETSISNNSISVTLIDPGPEFDSASAVPVERRGDEAHGMGLKLMSDVASARRYERRDGRNRFTLTFRKI